jgi:hypothetical protein
MWCGSRPTARWMAPRIRGRQIHLQVHPLAETTGAGAGTDTELSRSILRRAFDVIDYEELAGAFGGFEFQAEFL